MDVQAIVNEMIVAGVPLHFDWKGLVRATIAGKATMTQDMATHMGKSNILPVLHLCARVMKRPMVVSSVVPLDNGVELGDKYTAILKVRVFLRWVCAICI